MFSRRRSQNLSPAFPEAKEKRRSFFGKSPRKTNTRGPAVPLGANAKIRSKAKTNAPVHRGGVSTRALADTWAEKDNVGVQDFVMLDNFTDVNAFMKNLEQRYLKDLIYTYIGNVVISVNPYKDTGIYTDDYARMYSNCNLYELPPHVYGVADQAYRQMRDELTDQCVLISGESGAGKTEASKKILQFLALNSTNTGKAGNIRDRLMETNAILEAFGNAKTIRNDNSSRFGKYMEVQFDYKGEPLGGRILNYLLEKSRVIYQMQDERNFHIFYFLMSSSEASRLNLPKDPADFHYTNQGNATTVKTLDDTKEFGHVYSALQKEGFSPQEINELFSAVGFILQLGQVEFESNGRDASRVKNNKILSILSKLIGVDESIIGDSLTHRTIVTTMESTRANLSQDKAYYARDALGKALYNRVFTWVVERVNKSIAATDTGSRTTVMGLLDIYGFEIMQTNSFEQFCINYCNEKLQQLFIELTLRGEQEEYKKEGITWEPIKYFDNKIICEMVEARHKGVIAILDEECIRPGQATDASFLSRLNQSLGAHDHYRSFETVDAKTKRRGSFRGKNTREEFRIIHYAGTVTYNVNGFMDKNNDLLFRDLKECMMESTNEIVKSSFPKSELESKKRPVTAGTQFKTSLNKLVDILMQKTPSYVRCVKPNHAKAYRKFDKELVDHQVQYLGLMENLRVRRAGFAYRRSYEVFLDRYKPLSPQTWPSYDGPAKEGVKLIVDSLGFTEEMFRMGTTKIFIRYPKTVAQLEKAYNQARNGLATKIAAHVRGYQQRQRFLEMKLAAIIIARNWKRVYQRRCEAVSRIARQWRIIEAKRHATRLKSSVDTIKNFIRGWLQRFQPPNELNRKFVGYVRISWLDQLKSCLPYNVLDKSWITNSPVYLKDTSELLRKLHQRHMVRKYVKACTGLHKQRMNEKLFASGLFMEKKLAYPNSIEAWFQEERLAEGALNAQPLLSAAVKKILDGSPGMQLKYITDAKKFDRKSYKERDYTMLLTSNSIFVLEPGPKKVKIKFSVTLSDLVGIHISPGHDGLMILKTENMKAKGAHSKVKDKGDFILHVPSIIEAATKISLALNRAVNAQAHTKLLIQSKLSHCLKGKPEDPKPIALVDGPELSFFKDKKAKMFTVQTPVPMVPAHYTKYREDKGVPKRDPKSLQFGNVKKVMSRRSSISSSSVGSGGHGRGRGGRGRGQGRGRSGPQGRSGPTGRGRGGRKTQTAFGSNNRQSTSSLGSRYSGFGDSEPASPRSMTFEEQPMYEEVVSSPINRSEQKPYGM